MGGYAAANTLYRPNADFNIQRATALVEIVNVPETFVSSNPYYVVDKIKQIKPFLLLLQGAAPSQPSVGPVDPNSTGAIPSGPASTTAVAGATAASSPVSRKGRLFKHDPQLRLKTTYFGQALEVVSSHFMYTYFRPFLRHYTHSRAFSNEQAWLCSCVTGAS